MIETAVGVAHVIGDKVALSILIVIIIFYELLFGIRKTFDCPCVVVQIRDILLWEHVAGVAPLGDRPRRSRNLTDL